MIALSKLLSSKCVCSLAEKTTCQLLAWDSCNWLKNSHILLNYISNTSTGRIENKLRRFTKEEDKIIVDYVDKYGYSWKLCKDLDEVLCRGKPRSIATRIAFLYKKPLSLISTSHLFAFSAEEDKIILEYVEKYGERTDTFKLLCKELSRKYWTNIRIRYLHITNRMDNHGKPFTKIEDQIILDYVKKNGCSSKSYEDLAKLLNRGAAVYSIRKRVIILQTENEYFYTRSEKLLKHLHNVHKIEFDDISSLNSVKQCHFKYLDQENAKSCLNYFRTVLLPILKTHMLGLPHSNDWMQELDEYIINEKIESMIKVDYHVLSNKMFPGQTADSLRKYVSNRSQNINKKYYNLTPSPLWEFLQRNQSNKSARIIEKRLKLVEYVIAMVYIKADLYKTHNAQKPKVQEPNAQKPNAPKPNVGKFNLII